MLLLMLLLMLYVITYVINYLCYITYVMLLSPWPKLSISSPWWVERRHSWKSSDLNRGSACTITSPFSFSVSLTSLLVIMSLMVVVMIVLNNLWNISSVFQKTTQVIILLSSCLIFCILKSKSRKNDYSFHINSHPENFEKYLQIEVFLLYVTNK